MWARPALAFVCAALGACSRFDAAADGPDASDSGTPPPMDASVADAPPLERFCTKPPSAGKVLFCADFDGSEDIAAEWPDRTDLNRMFLSAKSFDGNRALLASGSATNTQHDRLRSGKLQFTPGKSVEIEVRIFLGQALSDMEILKLEGSDEATSPILYLSGDQLKIRLVDDDSAGIPLPAQKWSSAVLIVTPGMTTLRVGTDMVTFTGVASLPDSELSAGLYYKQDDGQLDYALDDIRLTER